MIEFKNVSKKYGTGTEAVQNANFKIEKGEFAFLVGTSGSGKSTWSKKYHPNLPIVSRDIIRYKLRYTSGPDEKAKLSRSQEELVTKEEYKSIDWNR